MTWLPDLPSVQNARFQVLDGPHGGDPFEVQFNPASLDYSISSEFDPGGTGNAARQFVKKTSAKLTMTLVYDTTEGGQDVRGHTGRLAQLLEPGTDGDKQFAPRVQFSWGSFSFRGVVEQYKETIDFFSAEGVPLRASVNLTLASQEVEFNASNDPVPAADRSPRADPVVLPPGASPGSVAGGLGNPRGARAIASASGALSLTAGAGVSLSVGASVEIGAAASFSLGGGAGLGIGAGAGIEAGIGAGAGIGVGASAGIGIGASAGVGIGASAGIGAGASLGAGTGVNAAIVATAGPAFGGLSFAPPTPAVSVASAQASLLGAPAVGASAGFQAGGQAKLGGGGSLVAGGSLQAGGGIGV